MSGKFAMGMRQAQRMGLGVQHHFLKSPAMTRRDESGGQLGHFKGTIERKGDKFGFITCEELAEQGHSKVFVLANEFKNFQPGQIVRFSAYLDGQQRCQGKDLRSGLKDEDPHRSQDLEMLGEFTGVISGAGDKFGFIECEDLAEHGGKAFILRTELKEYKVGHTVKFTASLDDKQRLQATNLKSGLKESRAPVTRVASLDTPTLGEFFGTIESHGDKYGFIACEDLVEHGKAFILKTDLKEYKVGHIVKFTAFLDEQGRLQGKDLKSGLKSSEERPKRSAAAQSVLQVLGTFRGRIDSRSSKYGFIKCPKLALEGHADVFVLATELNGFEAGQDVKFTAYVNEQMRLQGKDLRPEGNSQAMRPNVFGQARLMTSTRTKFGALGMAAPMAVMRVAKPMLKGMNVQRSTTPRSPLDEAETLGEFKGTITTAGAKYGFIDCDELKEEGHENVFILADQMKLYKPGMIVKFTAYLDSKGRLQGKDLKSGLK